MRRWSFIVGILGLFILFSILMFGEGVEVENVDGLEVNEKVIVSGEIVKEMKFGGSVKFELDRGMFVLCDNCGFGFVGKEVEIKGVVQEVYGVKMVGVLRMVVSS